MNYFYPDFKALRFVLKHGGVNCFWRNLFFGIRIKKSDELHQFKVDYRRFVIFWEGLFVGIKGLFTGKVL